MARYDAYVYNNGPYGVGSLVLLKRDYPSVWAALDDARKHPGPNKSWQYIITEVDDNKSKSKIICIVTQEEIMQEKFSYSQE